MVCKECENRFRVFGGLKTKTMNGAEFGSQLWVEPKSVDEVGDKKRG